MESIHFQHNALTAAEITTRRLCRLHRVRLFSPALCRVKRGSKVIVQGESRVLATPQQLIVLPADVELEVINQPENGLFCSDLLSLTPELLTRFKTRYLSEPPPGRLTSLCAPVTTELAFMWQSVLQAVREGLSVALQQHQRFSALRYWRTMRIFPSAATGRTAAAPSWWIKSHFASCPLARTVSSYILRMFPSYLSCLSRRTTGMPSFSTLFPIVVQSFPNPIMILFTYGPASGPGFTAYFMRWVFS